MKKKFLAVLSCGLAATFLFGCQTMRLKVETTAAQTEPAKESQKPSEETAERRGQTPLQRQE